MALKMWIDMTIGIVGAVAITAILYYIFRGPENISLIIAIVAMLAFYALRIIGDVRARYVVHHRCFNRNGVKSERRR